MSNLLARALRLRRLFDVRARPDETAGPRLVYLMSGTEVDDRFGDIGTDVEFVRGPGESVEEFGQRLLDEAKRAGRAVAFVGRFSASSDEPRDEPDDDPDGDDPDDDGADFRGPGGGRVLADVGVSHE